MNTPDAMSENHVIAERRMKLDALRTQAQASLSSAFPNDFKPQHRAMALLSQYDLHTADDLEKANLEVVIAGRIVLKRVMGKASFITLQDGSGRIQCYITLDLLGSEAYSHFKHWDLGDIVGVKGYLFRTKTNELSVKAHHVRLLTKSIRPLPEKYHGLHDQEIKYRQRYVDLIASEHSRQVFLTRSQTLNALRHFMHEQNFLEVETPMLHPIPGGANARPFNTHHHALDMSMFLRIAPELYLKRLIVGGFDRVFELNRNFRNEGISVRHNPEFTMMEFYAAYTDYHWLMDFTETCLRTVIQQVCHTQQLDYQGQTLDFSQSFQRLTMVEALQKVSGYAHTALHDLEFLRTEVKRLAGDVPSHATLATLQLALFELTTESQLWQPTYIVDYPVEVSPLARESDQHAGIAERFELFIAGRELANGFSELNDAEEQARRLRLQASSKESGDNDAMHYDADFIRALEYGMPPTAGCGIGIDRLVMLLTDSANIRDVILFPHLRPERG